MNVGTCKMTRSLYFYYYYTYYSYYFILIKFQFDIPRASSIFFVPTRRTAQLVRSFYNPAPQHHSKNYFSYNIIDVFLNYVQFELF